MRHDDGRGAGDGDDHDALSDFHNRFSMQGGAYANATWVVGVAKAGIEEGSELSIIAPTGEVVAQTLTLGDELVVARCDLDLGKSYKETPPAAQTVSADRGAGGGREGKGNGPARAV